jgi:hypothetical protein
MRFAPDLILERDAFMDRFLKPGLRGILVRKTFGWFLSPTCLLVSRDGLNSRQRPHHSDPREHRRAAEIGHQDQPQSRPAIRATQRPGAARSWAPTYARGRPEKRRRSARAPTRWEAATPASRPRAEGRRRPCPQERWAHRQELYAKARRCHIEGRSRMTKRQLENALGLR